MSTHRVEVVQLGPLERHPNADSLSIVHVYKYQIVVRTEDWREGQLAAYVVPDSILPNKPEYDFLKGHNRIRVAKLRGQISQGLLIPAPEGAQLGDNVAEQLGIVAYEPPVQTRGGMAVKGPGIYAPSYDLENYHRYGHLLGEGIEVSVSEKVHGTSNRLVYHDKKYFAGSRNQWLKEDPSVVYWRPLETEKLRDFLRTFEDHVVYGEIYGWVQNLRYGHQAGKTSFAIFDVLDTDTGQWWTPEEVRAECSLYSLPVAPELYTGPFDAALVEALAEGATTLMSGAEKPHIREGIVIEPSSPRTDPEIGRVKLKLVSNAYLMKSD